MSCGDLFLEEKAYMEANYTLIMHNRYTNDDVM